jgi:hypothetical protein
MPSIAAAPSHESVDVATIKSHRLAAMSKMMDLVEYNPHASAEQKIGTIDALTRVLSLYYCACFPIESPVWSAAKEKTRVGAVHQAIIISLGVSGREPDHYDIVN